MQQSCALLGALAMSNGVALAVREAKQEWLRRVWQRCLVVAVHKKIHGSVPPMPQAAQHLEEHLPWPHLAMQRAPCRIVIVTVRVAVTAAIARIGTAGD